MEIIFVCWGNICRSPMAERVAIKMAAERGIKGNFSSAGISDEEHGNQIDPRAAKVLAKAGYHYQGHRAHAISAEEILSADLVVAAEPFHISHLSRIAPGANNLVLLNDFNPNLSKGTPLPDPWYGDESGFVDTLKAIENAMPMLLAELN